MCSKTVHPVRGSVIKPQDLKISQGVSPAKLLKALSAEGTSRWTAVEGAVSPSGSNGVQPTSQTVITGAESVAADDGLESRCPLFRSPFSASITDSFVFAVILEILPVSPS